MIDASTGSLVLGKVRLAPRSGVAELIASELGKQVREVSHSGVMRSYSLALEEGGQQMSYVLSFVDGNLMMAIAAAVLPNEGGWDDWSPNVERQRRLRNDAMLRDWLGTTKGQFRWGYAESGVDPKTGSSIISVSYIEPHHFSS